MAAAFGTTLCSTANLKGVPLSKSGFLESPVSIYNAHSAQYGLYPAFVHTLTDLAAPTIPMTAKNVGPRLGLHVLGSNCTYHNS